MSQKTTRNLPETARRTGRGPWTVNFQEGNEEPQFYFALSDGTPITVLYQGNEELLGGRKAIANE